MQSAESVENGVALRTWLLSLERSVRSEEKDVCLRYDADQDVASSSSM